MAREQRCRICGCTDANPCVVGGYADPNPACCGWAEGDLCSACAPLAAVEAELARGALPAEVAYRLGRACGKFRMMLPGGGGA